MIKLLFRRLFRRFEKRWYLFWNVEGDNRVLFSLVKTNNVKFPMASSGSEPLKMSYFKAKRIKRYLEKQYKQQHWLILCD